MMKKFNIGDRVVIGDKNGELIISHPLICVGKRGVVIAIDNYLPYVYLVKFDTKFVGQHRGDNNEDPTGRSRYFDQDFLYDEKEYDDTKINMKNIDPYGEENWLCENHIKTYDEFQLKKMNL